MSKWIITKSERQTFHTRREVIEELQRLRQLNPRREYTVYNTLSKESSLKLLEEDSQ